MKPYAPIARIILRYGVGAVFTISVGDMCASVPDLVNVLAAGLSGLVSAAIDWFYARVR